MTVTKNRSLKFKHRNINETSLEWTDQHRSTINLMVYIPLGILGNINRNMYKNLRIYSEGLLYKLKFELLWKVLKHFSSLLPKNISYYKQSCFETERQEFLVWPEYFFFLLYLHQVHKACSSY